MKINLEKLKQNYEAIDDIGTKQVILHLIRALEIQREALQKIYEPEKYHHVEPDGYTQAGCFQFVSQEALKKVDELVEFGEGK